MKILYISRGRGRGHAVADIAIGAELAALVPEARIVYVSYGTGARTFAEQGVEAVDLGLPDANSIAATTVILGRLIDRMRPDAVVAHEEFPALPVAKIFDVPVIFLTDFFGEPGKFSAESLRFADRILFLDVAGAEAEPEFLRGRVRYLGPPLRRFRWRRRDRARARRELGLDAERLTIGVFPGSWTEAMTPLAGRLPGLLDRAVDGPKQILWLTGETLPAHPELRTIGQDWEMDRLLAACDLAVTKCNRMTVHEAAWMGIRTLSVDYRKNSTDTDLIARLGCNTTVRVGELDAAVIRRCLEAAEPAPYRPRRMSAAKAVAGWVRRVLGGR